MARWMEPAQRRSIHSLADVCDAMTESSLPSRSGNPLEPSTATVPAVDLSNCDREQIQLCGAIQPHAALLVLQETALTVLQASSNVEALLGVPLDGLLGQPVSAVLGDTGAEALRAQLRREDLNDGLPHLLTLPRLARREAAFHLFGHRNPDVLLLEFEPAALPDPGSPPEVHTAVRGTLHRLQHAPSLQAFLELAVDEIRAFTGFDRVMAYRFAADGSGQVIAESLAQGLEPYLGLHYPASDIPEPARRLFRLNWVRHLPDVDYVPVPLVPELNPLTSAPVDLSYSFSRSVSVMYTGYLRNMGVRATLVMTLLNAGEVWGLISCMHHRSPKRVSFETRLAAEFVAHMVSLLLSEKETIEHQAYRARLGDAVDALLAAMSRAATLHEALAGAEPNLLAAIDATGAAVVTDDRVSLLGATPSEAEVRALADWLAERGESRFASHALSDDYPPAGACLESCAGLLAIRLS
ncbi:MAG: GAF domain-containing protein, partial [Gammaproteobacteria bacterium]|nr:GAF domain-containing protein [Gammaproteobacteria bacterium]